MRRTLLVTTVLLALATAGSLAASPVPPSPLEAGAAPSSSTGVVAAADGTPIAWESWGDGAPALVFVHCWSCDREFWRGTAERLAADHRVVLLDLPGHGASGRERASWTLDGLAADVATVVEHLDLDEVVLVGHSMGGPVSLLAAPRLGDRLRGVVCADTLHDADFVWPEGLTASMAGRLEADRDAFMDAFIPSMFPPDADPELVAWTRAAAMEADPAATAALMRDFETLDLPAALGGAGVPVRCINAAPRPPQGMVTAIETNRRYADFDAVLLDGVGHFLQLDAPERFAAELRRILAALSSR